MKKRLSLYVHDTKYKFVFINSTHFHNVIGKWLLLIKQQIISFTRIIYYFWPNNNFCRLFFHIIFSSDVWWVWMWDVLYYKWKCCSAELEEKL